MNTKLLSKYVSCCLDTAKPQTSDNSQSDRYFVDVMLDDEALTTEPSDSQSLLSAQSTDSTGKGIDVCNDSNFFIFIPIIFSPLLLLFSEF